MQKKLLAICSLFCFCLMLFATAFAEERNCPMGIKANVPSEYVFDEEEEDSITFIDENSISMIMIGVIELESGQTFDSDAKQELLNALCEDREINITSEKDKTIGNRKVYTVVGNMQIEDMNMKAYIYVFQIKNKVIFSVCFCKEDDNRANIFENVVKSIH